MNKIEVKICIDVDDNAQVIALNEFLMKIGKTPGIDFSKRVTKKETQAPVIENEVVNFQDKIEPNPTDIKIEDIRALVQQKATVGQRDKIKAKLTDLGAPNVTKLEPKRYGAFVEFLNSLS